MLARGQAGADLEPEQAAAEQRVGMAVLVDHLGHRVDHGLGEPLGPLGLFGRNLYVGQRIPLAGVAHQNGTIRFGDDPKTSALDRNCKAHDLDNLYVVDGSFFPSSAAVNPALTIMANAMRVGDHLMKRMGITETVYEQNRLQERELAVAR